MKKKYAAKYDRLEDMAAAAVLFAVLIGAGVVSLFQGVGNLVKNKIQITNAYKQR